MRVLTNTEAVELLADHLAIFEADMASGNINWASRTLERMFGYTIPGDLEGRPIETLVPDAVKEKHRTEHRPAFAMNPEPRLMGRKLALSGRRANGTVFPVEVMLMPRAANRQRIVVGVVLDLSDRAPQPG
jgi:PAS domain S-box-containing protein